MKPKDSREHWIDNMYSIGFGYNAFEFINFKITKLYSQSNREDRKVMNHSCHGKIWQKHCTSLWRIVMRYVGYGEEENNFAQ